MGCINGGCIKGTSAEFMRITSQAKKQTSQPATACLDCTDLKGHGDLVSGLIMGITGVIIPLIRLSVYLLSPSDHPSNELPRQID